MSSDSSAGCLFCEEDKRLFSLFLNFGTAELLKHLLDALPQFLDLPAVLSRTDLLGFVTFFQVGNSIEQRLFFLEQTLSPLFFRQSFFLQLQRVADAP